MESYDTLVEAIEALRLQGYNLDFNIAFDQVKCQQNGICLNPSQFEIDKFFRFEGDTNPADQDILYAISAKDQSIKGILTTAYGLYAQSSSAALSRKLAMHHE